MCKFETRKSITRRPDSSAIQATSGGVTPGTNADGLLSPEGRLNREAFKPVFGDFQDMYVDFARFVSLGAFFGSPTVDRGVLYVGSTDGLLYALE